MKEEILIFLAVLTVIMFIITGIIYQDKEKMTRLNLCVELGNSFQECHNGIYDSDF